VDSTYRNFKTIDLHGLDWCYCVTEMLFFNIMPKNCTVR